MVILVSVDYFSISSVVFFSSRTGSSQAPDSQVSTPKRGNIQRLRMYQTAITPTKINKDFIISSQVDLSFNI